MSDLIERKAAIDAISCNIKITGRQNAELVAETIGTFVDRIKALPSAQPERKKGAWIKTGQSFVFPEKFRNYSCSECGYDIDKTKFNYCPNCGADNREVKE